MQKTPASTMNKKEVTNPPLSVFSVTCTCSTGAAERSATQRLRYHVYYNPSDGQLKDTIQFSYREFVTARGTTRADWTAAMAMNTDEQEGDELKSEESPSIPEIGYYSILFEIPEK